MMGSHQTFFEPVKLHLEPSDFAVRTIPRFHSQRLAPRFDVFLCTKQFEARGSLRSTEVGGDIWAPLRPSAFFGLCVGL